MSTSSPSSGGLARIVSGGQTGVDRGALDAALELGFPCGGWCPPGRLAEDGPIDRRYPVLEMRFGGYEDRTLQNVLDSDGTLVIHFGRLEGGTALTVTFCVREKRPYILIDASQLSAEQAATLVASFIAEHAISTLNVAGPRQSKAAAAHDYSRDVMRLVIGACGTGGSRSIL